MNLLKTSVLSGISNIVKLITSFITGKFLAIYIGPSGIAFLGQFQNFINIVMTFSNAGINSGVTKYVSEFNENKEERNRYISTSFFITIISSSLLSILIFIYSSYLSTHLLKNSNYSYIFRILSVSLILFSINNFFISILNGLKEIKKLIIINIISSIVAAVFTLILVYYYKIEGALISYVTSQSFIFIITLLFSLKINSFKIFDIFNGIYRENSINLLKFSLMSIISVICVNLSQIYIRDYVVKSLSPDFAGYWQGMNKISELYLTFITTTLTVYYLPKLSEIKDNLNLKKEIISGYKIILPVLAIINISIYFFRDTIIKIVFTEKFIPMQELFAFQMLGDFFKISSWLLAFLMIAKAMTKTFIFTEIIFSLLGVFLSIYFLENSSFIGLSYAYFANYLIYTLTMVYIFKGIIFYKEDV